MKRDSMLPAMCKMPPWMNIDVTIVISGSIGWRVRGAPLDTASVTAAGTSANLSTTTATRGPSDSSYTNTATFTAINVMLTGVRRRGAALSRSGIIGNQAVAIVPARDGSARDRVLWRTNVRCATATY